MWRVLKSRQWLWGSITVLRNKDIFYEVIQEALMTQSISLKMTSNFWFRMAYWKMNNVLPACLTSGVRSVICPMVPWIHDPSNVMFNWRIVTMTGLPFTWLILRKLRDWFFRHGVKSRFSTITRMFSGKHGKYNFWRQLVLSSGLFYFTCLLRLTFSLHQSRNRADCWSKESKFFKKKLFSNC